MRALCRPRLLGALGGPLLGAILAGAGSVRTTFVPQWHLGDRWFVSEDEDEHAADGSITVRKNRYRYTVRAMDRLAPDLKRVHIDIRMWEKGAWDRVHLTFLWTTPGPEAPAKERLCLTRVTVRTREKPPRLVELDPGAPETEPCPVLATGGLFPVSFPVLEFETFTGASVRTFTPAPRPMTTSRPERPGAERGPVAVRQTLVNAPEPPDGLTLTVERERLIQYRLESAQDPLTNVRQIWHPDYPWWVFEWAPNRRSRLDKAEVVAGDPMALVDQAAALSQRLGTNREGAALWSFRNLLTDALRDRLDREGGVRVAPTVADQRTRDLLGEFAVPGLTATFAYTTSETQALVEASGVTAGGSLTRRHVVCFVETGRWKLASGTRPAATSQPVGPPGPPARRAAAP